MKLLNLRLKTHAQRLCKSPVYNVCKSLVRIKITALTIDAHKGFTYKVKRKGCFWRVFLNSLNIPSRLYEFRAKFSVANETYFLYVAMQTRLNFVRNLADMGN